MTTPPQTGTAPPLTTQPANTQTGGYTPGQLGGGYHLPAPIPPVTPFLLSPDAFMTLRDGEMSEPRALRDASVGAFLVGAAAIASQLSTLDWDAAVKENRHPIFWTVVIFVITATALVTAVITHVLCQHTRRRSAYSRQVETISAYFHIEDTEPGLLSWFRRIFTRSSK